RIADVGVVGSRADEFVVAAAAEDLFAVGEDVVATVPDQGCAVARILGDETPRSGERVVAAPADQDAHDSDIVPLTRLAIVGDSVEGHRYASGARGVVDRVAAEGSFVIVDAAVKRIYAGHDIG